jgi:SAM-dependent methyltransferase
MKSILAKESHMPIRGALETMIPESFKVLLRPVRNRFVSKYDSELSFWQRRFELENGSFVNSQYEPMMLAIAEEHTQSFVAGKIIADFGCGPLGTLQWAESALMRIGIDVLADRYADAFYDTIISHNMVYIKSTERVIPLPSEFVDIMFTVNAMDHVDNFSSMCSEIIRVMKPGGELIGSFNLEEPATACEPQRLDESIIDRELLRTLRIKSYRVSDKGPEDNPYASFLNGTISYTSGREGFLWVRAMKDG